MKYTDIIPEAEKYGPSVVPEEVAPSRRSKSGSGPAYTQSRSIQSTAHELIERKCICISPDAAELDAYKILRTQILQRTREQGHNVIMVTSIGRGEGKTLTAINLSLTLAREFNHTVLLVDADLRKQDIHKTLGFESPQGIADNLLEDVPLTELIVWPEIDKFTVISGGKTIQESTELLGSPRMKELIAELKGRYPDRYIIIDVPALASGADAAAFAPLVDGIVVVVRHGQTSEKDLKGALRLLPKKKILGFVVNRKQ